MTVKEMVKIVRECSGPQRSIWAAFTSIDTRELEATHKHANVRGETEGHPLALSRKPSSSFVFFPGLSIALAEDRKRGRVFVISCLDFDAGFAILLRIMRKTTTSADKDALRLGEIEADSRRWRS